MHLEVRLLGPLTVTIDDAETDVGSLGQRERAVLALLALNTGGIVPASRLVDELWPDDPPNRALNTVQVYVSHLRRHLGRDGVRTAAGGYSLNGSPHDIDAAVFESLGVRGKRALSAGRFAEAVDLLGRAEGLWRGDPFVDTYALPSLQAESVRLDDLRRTIAEDRFEAAIALGEGAGLVDQLETACRDAPLRERLVAALMLALFQSGRHPEALDVYAQHRRRCVAELGLDPGPRLQRLQRAILDGGKELRPAAWPLGRLLKSTSAAASLPAQRTPLVGRDDELAELTDTLRQQDTRLVTLTGPGGAGKTRLAIALAQNVISDYPDGVYFVPLATVTDAETIWTTLAETLDVPPERRATPSLLTYLAHHVALIVLDNLEQVPRAGEVVSAVLDAAARIDIVATSRRTVHAVGEHDYPVPPLWLPHENGVGLDSSPAVQLFALHATMANPAFHLTNQNTATVAELCRRLDGLPLAIELAAARSKVLGPQALLRRLGTPLDLSDRAVGRPRRQQSLRATIAWSVDLLSPAAQATLRRLGVFAGGCDQGALGALLESTDVDAVALIVDELVDASLIAVTEGPDGEPRLGMLETVRAYALDQLREYEELDPMALRHAEHYAGALADSGFDFTIYTTRSQATMRLIDGEYDNFVAALQRLLDRTERTRRRLGRRESDLAMSLCAQLTRYWVHRGNFAEVVRYQGSVNESVDGADSPARLLFLIAPLGAPGAFIESHQELAIRSAREAVSVGRRLADEHLLAKALLCLANSLTPVVEEWQQAAEAADEAVLLGGRSGDAVTLSSALSLLGTLKGQRDEIDEQLRLETAALEVAESFGDSTLTLRARHNHACALRRAGRLDLAREEMEAVTRSNPVLGWDRVNLVARAEDYAALLADQGHLLTAVRLFGAADSALSRAGLPRPQLQESEIASSFTQAKANLPAATWEAAYRSGWETPLETVLEQVSR